MKKFVLSVVQMEKIVYNARMAQILITSVKIHLDIKIVILMVVVILMLIVPIVKMIFAQHVILVGIFHMVVKNPSNNFLQNVIYLVVIFVVNLMKILSLIIVLNVKIIFMILKPTVKILYNKFLAKFMDAVILVKNVFNVKLGNALLVIQGLI